MTTRRAQKSSPLRFDDGFRGAIAMGLPVLALLVLFLLNGFDVVAIGDMERVFAACAALTVAFTAYIVWMLMGAVAAAVFGAESGGALLTLLVLLTAVSAWMTVVYAFALRYLRLHAAGEEFVFEIDEQPGFADFLSLALMVAAAGSLAPAAPRTRASLRAVRTHTVIAFAFNALVIAVTVSLISGLITTFGVVATG